MDEGERAAAIDGLRRRLSEAIDRKSALLSDLKELAAKIGQVRETLGNPFFYSGGNYGRPENADESIANFTGYKSHEPALRLARSLKDADRDVRALRAQLQGFGVNLEGM